MVGRGDLLSRLDAWLADDTRLLTLLGPAGVGKTCLALTWAARLRADATSRATSAFCDASAAATLDDLVVALALALGSPPTVGPQPLDVQLRDLARRAAPLPDRPALLVLDSLEAAAPAAPRVLRGLLAAAPNLRILVTTRTRLRLQHESVLDVPPLAPADALALFHRRARMAGAPPALTLDHPRLGELVARLDGLPLALELAAARAAALGIDEVLARLDLEPAFLAADAEDLPDRHRTLVAAVAWSWALLPPLERSALAALALFEGPFGLSAAEHVLDRGAWPSTLHAASVLATLHGHSLLHLLRDDAPSPPRFRLLAPIRDQVRRLATESVLPTDAFALRHAEWCLDLAAPDPTPTDGRDAVRGTLERVARHRDDLRAAQRRMRATHPALAARLALAGQAALVPLGPDTAPDDLLDSAVACAARAGEPALEAEGLHRRGATKAKRGDLDAAEGDLRAALDRVAALADPAAEARIRIDLGHLLHVRGERPDAHAQLASARDLAMASGHPGLAARAHNFLGESLADAGDLAAAVDALEQAIALATAADSFVSVFARGTLARIHAAIGHVERAEEVASAALELAQRWQTPPLRIYADVSLAAVQLARGATTEARARLRSASRAATQSSHLTLHAHAELWLAVAALLLHSRTEARAAIAKAAAHLPAGDRQGHAALALPPPFVHGARTAARPPAPPTAAPCGLEERLLRQILAPLWRLAPAPPPEATPSSRPSAAGEAPGTVVIASSGATLTLPGGREVRLTHRPRLVSILATLAHRRRDAPEETVGATELYAAAWPGESLARRSGINRLYVSISVLRDLGLEQHLLAARGGYFLNPSTTVVVDD